jgi:hypothetical protein
VALKSPAKAVGADMMEALGADMIKIIALAILVFALVAAPLR